MRKALRSALSKVWCGIATIQMETGRYERLPVSEGTCTRANAGWKRKNWNFC